MENYKELLTALYKEYAPNKIDQIDFYLDRYKGKEKQFYITQKAKYAKKRSVTDSKKILEEAMARIALQKKKLADQKKAIHEQAKPKPIKKAIEPAIESKKEIEKEVIIPEPTVIDKTEKLKASDKTEEKNREVDNEVKMSIEKTEKRKEVVFTEPKSEKEISFKEKDIKNEEKPIIVDTTKNLNPSYKKTTETIIDKDLKSKDTIEVESQSNIADLEKQRIAQKEKHLAQQDKNRILTKEKEEKEKKEAVLLWYIGVIAFVVLVVALIVYFTKFSDHENDHKEDVSIQKVVLENQKVNTTGDNSTTKEIDQKEKAETQASKEPVVEEKVKHPKTKPQKETPKKVAVKEKPVKRNARTSYSNAQRLYADDFNRPAVFVGCFAVKEESLAQKKVKALIEHNLNAHYYWIPDINKQGNSYFKVVIGPFNSLSEAYPSLTKVQERINFDAYILIIK